MRQLRGTLRFLPWMVFCVLCTSATAASFECGRASSHIEKLICLDYRLSDLDSELAAVYADMRAQPSAKSEMQTEQRKWLAVRNRCASFSCVRDAYIDRLSALSPTTAEIYAAMRAPSSKRWEYVAPAGSTIARSFILHGQIMTQQSGPFLSKKWEWVMLDDGKTIAQEFTDRLPPYEPGLRDKQPISLGQNLELSSAGSSMCFNGVGELGLTVDESVDHISKRRSRILVALIREERSSYEPIGSCFEVELNHRRASFSETTVFDDSLYWIDKTFSIRFDQQLWTQSNLVGRKVFLLWGNDLSGMVDPHCKTYDRECADKRFDKLLKDVSGFYQ